MDASESSRSRNKRDAEDRAEARESSRIEEDDDRDGSDKRKRRSSRFYKHSSQDEVEEQDSGRRKSTGDRSDTKKKSGDEDDYGEKKESRTKIPRKSLDERGERRMSEGYRDNRDMESSHRSRDEEHELDSTKKLNAKPSSGHEGSQVKSGSKVESSHEKDVDRGRERDSRYSERKESNREKDYSRQEQEINPPRRRVDDRESGRRADDNNHGDRKSSDQYKHGSSREKENDLRNERVDSRSRVVDLNGEKGAKSDNREDKRADGERNHIRSDAQDGDSRGVSSLREARDDNQRKDGESRGVSSLREARGDNQRKAGESRGVSSLREARDDNQRKDRERSEDLDPNAQRHSAKPYGEKVEKQRRDEVQIKERSNVMNEDGHVQMRDRNGRDIRQTKRSRSPERSGRYHREMDEHDKGYLESDTERNTGSKGKERDTDSYRDDRSSKGKDNWEGSKDYWRRGHSRQDAKGMDNNEPDHFKDWDSQRRDQERMVGDKLYGSSGYRKDNRGRPDGFRKSSNSGAMIDNSDSIEIRPNQNLDFGREEMASTFPARRSEVVSQQNFGSVSANDDEWSYPLEDRFQDDSSAMDPSSGRNSLDSPAGRGRGQKGPMNLNRTGSGQSVSSGMHPSQHNQGSFNRVHQSGQKGGRPGRGRGGRQPGRDSPRVGLQLPMMGPPPFGPLSLPPGPMQPIGHNLNHSPGPPLPPGVFAPPFPGLVWPGAKGVDLNMLAVPQSLPPMPPPGPGGPRFGPNIGSASNHSAYFNQPGSGRGGPTSLPGPVFNPGGGIGREVPHEKPPSGWGQTRNSAPSGKAPSRGEQNDYSQNFVDTGMRPQNFIRELELTNVVEDYPKLRELIQRKDEIVAKSASPPMYYKCDLKEHVLSPEFFGTKFDVILVDPPWEEYVHRAPGVTDHLEYWTFEEIQNLKIEAIADTPSFIFLWVGDGVGLEQGRQCLKKWGFRRCEDICWVKTNKKNATSGLRHDSNTVLQHSKEHCLMGIKGTVRRSTDGHIIHANIDTDIIIAEEPTDGSTKKPDDMYRIIEHFALGRRRLELFGEDHNIRSGWLTVGRGLSSSNFNAEAYIRGFADKDGKVWQGGGGRNPPPEASHLVLTTPEIESLRPKSPPAKSQQQQQQQSMSSLVSTGNANNRRASASSPQTHNAPSFSGMNQDPSCSDPTANLVPWGSSPMLRGPDGGGHDDKFFDGYGFNPTCGQVVGDHIEFDPHRTSLNMNMM